MSSKQSNLPPLPKHANDEYNNLLGEFLDVDRVTEAWQVANLLDLMAAQPLNPPCILIEPLATSYPNPSWLSLLLIHLTTTEKTYVVDVLTLGGQAFQTPSKNSAKLTLKVILESKIFPKIVCQGGKLSNILRSNFAIDLQNTVDIICMDQAIRSNIGQETDPTMLYQHLSVEEAAIWHEANANADASGASSFESPVNAAQLHKRPLNIDLLALALLRTQMRARVFAKLYPSLSPETMDAVRLQSIQHMARA